MLGKVMQLHGHTARFQFAKVTTPSYEHTYTPITLSSWGRIMRLYHDGEQRISWLERKES